MYREECLINNATNPVTNAELQKKKGLFSCHLRHFTKHIENIGFSDVGSVK